MARATLLAARCLATVAVLAVALGLADVLAPRASLADVYRTFQVSAWADSLATRVGARQVATRELRLNGIPLSFSVAHSSLPVADIVRAWGTSTSETLMEVYARATDTAELMLSAGALDFVKVRRFSGGESWGAAVQFFNGDPVLARKYLDAFSSAPADRLPPLSGQIVIASRPDGASTTDVLILRIEDLGAVLGALDRVPPASLPRSMSLPDGAQIVMLIEDKVANRRSVTLAASGPGTPAHWLDHRARKLEQAGLTVSRSGRRRDGSLALSAQGQGMQVDAVFQNAGDAGNVVTEIVHVISVTRSANGS